MKHEPSTLSPQPWTQVNIYKVPADAFDYDVEDDVVRTPNPNP